MRRLAMCFDGTWNDVKDQTNVSRIHAAIEAIPEQPGARPAQLKYYDEGVGTHFGSKISGGMLGNGLTENIREGYAWLIRNWRDEDRLYLFGFSRGAFTARSLAGMIGKCGIVEEDDPSLPTRERKARSLAAAARVTELYKRANLAGGDPMTELAGRTRVIRIHFIGVWDTVGALGVPLLNLSYAEKFHDTKLGDKVDNAYHALAIDEHRADYQATLWTEIPDRARQKVEQRWFPGAHANVGGGYQDDLLPEPPLAWIAGKARDCGLEISDELIHLDGTEYRSPVVDSFAQFGFGLYRAIKGFQPYLRPIGETVAETVDDTALKKWAAEFDYRPVNLAHATTAVALPGVGISRGSLTGHP
ncbi:DUF2235 domain-containing protein [Parasulfuritortus cantonensis]|uniref:DUF2235 domain-containing protein n=1 Tax=Parasulfuritortus cantonensis TaxID=2528202 RepID=A0A4R1B2C6_9PROT|nr:DUF2235 domain-containing protein [Parasulfuritortus cantonensis]TCJ11590.1 DUF2235 domain-containing protein [Parasulfuritortus cantonensis]